MVGKYGFNGTWCIFIFVTAILLWPLWKFIYMGNIYGKCFSSYKYICWFLIKFLSKMDWACLNNYWIRLMNYDEIIYDGFHTRLDIFYLYFGIIGLIYFPSLYLYWLVYIFHLGFMSLPPCYYQIGRYFTVHMRMTWFTPYLNLESTRSDMLGHEFREYSTFHLTWSLPHLWCWFYLPRSDGDDLLPHTRCWDFLQVVMGIIYYNHLRCRFYQPRSDEDDLPHTLRYSA